MTDQTILTPHEMIELDELMQSEISCIKKMMVNQEQIHDSQLKSYMQTTLNAKKMRITELYQLVGNMQGSSAMSQQSQQTQQSQNQQWQ
jgi:hypothetical protein